jgi:hypothetical protein
MTSVAVISSHINGYPQEHANLIRAYDFLWLGAEARITLTFTLVPNEKYQ